MGGMFGGGGGGDGGAAAAAAAAARAQAEAAAAAKQAQDKQDQIDNQQRLMQAGLTGSRSLLTNDETGYQKTLLS